MLNRLLSLLLCATPLPAVAHPHVFVEARVTVEFNEDGTAAVHLDWRYDELFSLLVTSDMGLDMDGDLMLEPHEQDLLDEQIAAWPEDYTGDLEVYQADALLTLAEKENHRMIYEGGIFTEMHRRPIADRVNGAEPLVLRVYDPYFYTAYEVIGPVQVVGNENCSAAIEPADLDAAYALADRLGAQIGGTDDGDTYDFPQIGYAFADTIVVTCAAL